METNDFGQSAPHHSDDSLNSDDINAAEQQQEEPYTSMPAARYDGNQMNGDGSGRKKGRGFLFVILMIVCALLGGLITAYVIVPALTPSVVDIAAYARPAVVHVSVSVSADTLGEDYSDLPEDDIEYDGTGFVITNDGYIVTNNHVIAGSDAVTVILDDGSEYGAEIIGADITTDIAVLKIDGRGLKTLAIGDSDELKVGEPVVAIGNPLGLELSNTVTSGIISGLNRVLNSEGYTQEYLQTDAAINPGNSGGPLIDMEGRVIGINTLKSYIAGYDDYGQSISTEGIGFAIPISAAMPIIEQLIETGTIERPGIGISCLVDDTNYYNPSGSPVGVTVVGVTEGGPADLAGLESSDIILSIEGKPATTVEELTGVIYRHRVGDELVLAVWRAGEELEITVTVGNLNDMS